MEIETLKNRNLVSEQMAATYLGFTPRTLQNWRHERKGPSFIQISPRVIRYDVRDLDRWVEEKRVSSPSASKMELRG